MKHKFYWWWKLKYQYYCHILLSSTAGSEGWIANNFKGANRSKYIGVGCFCGGFPCQQLLWNFLSHLFTNHRSLNCYFIPNPNVQGYFWHQQCKKGMADIESKRHFCQHRDCYSNRFCNFFFSITISVQPHTNYVLLLM